MARTQHGRHAAQPPLIPRTGDSLLSGIPQYGTITLALMQVVAIVVNVSVAYALVGEQRRALAEIPAPAPSVKVVPGPTVTVQPTARRGVTRP